MAAIAGSVVGTVSSMKTTREGKKLMAKGQEGIDNFEWEELQNPYKNLTASTAGADLRKEEAARMAATSVNALRGGGTRALVGGIGLVQAQTNAINRESAADLDRQTKEIDKMVADDEVRLRAMTEKRQADELAGYGNMIDVGMDMKQKGNAGVAAGLNNLDEAIWDGAGAVMSKGASKGMKSAMGGSSGGFSTI